MTCQEFCKQFSVYIVFNRLGEGYIFGKGSHPPKYDDKLDFYIPTDGGDAKLLPCLVDDYQEHSSARKAITISFNGKETVKEEKKKLTMVDCKDFKPGDKINVNVEITDVCTYPDTANLKLEENIHCITAFDGKHEFMWKTKAKDIPKKGDKKKMSAVIKEQIDWHSCEIPAYSVASVKLLIRK